MKIIRLANEFEDEGRDPLEQIEDVERFEAQQEMDDIQTKGVTHTSEIISDISSVFVDQIKSRSTGKMGGTEAWFEYKDGKIYRVVVELAHPLNRDLDSSKLNTSDNLPY